MSARRILGGLLAAAACSIAAGGSDPYPVGVEAYENGRFQEALEAFVAAEERRGDRAPAELLYDQALAALGAGALREAEAAADKAAVRGGAAFADERDFLLGNASFARCLRAEAQALGPEAEPFAWDTAIGHAEDAVRFWQDAVLRRDGWPAAARNAERAQRKLAELRQQKAAADAQQDKRREKKAAPPEPRQRLMDQLARREQEKLARRRAQRLRQPIVVEQDW